MGSGRRTRVRRTVSFRLPPWVRVLLTLVLLPRPYIMGTAYANAEVKTMGATNTVARWVAEISNEDIPLDAIRVAKESCVDCVGTMVAGAAQPLGKIIQDYVRQMGGAPEASVVASTIKTSVPNAALANGTTGHAMDYDDVGGFGHPAVAIMPSLLSLGEHTHASGRDLLEAFVVGCEVGLSMSNAANYHAKQTQRGFHSTAVTGRLASAAACCRLLKLDQQATLMALGIAGSMASGLVHNIGTMTKPLHAGLTNRDGVMAAQLASMGFTSGGQVLEHPAGFMSTIYGAADLDLDSMAGNLGRPFLTQNSLSIKRYPTCGTNIDTLDSVLGLMQDHKFDYRDVEEIEVDQALDSPVTLYDWPENELQAKFSSRYNIAAALVDGKVDPDTFKPAKVNATAVQETMSLVRVNIGARWAKDHTHAGHPVKVRLKDGRVLERTTLRKDMLGGQSNPWGFDNIMGKFRSNVGRALPSDKLDAAAETWSDMEKIEDTAEAVQTLLADGR